MQGDVFTRIPVDGELTPDEEPARLVDMNDAARMLGRITPREVRNLFDEGELETIKLGRRRLIYVPSIDAYVERLRAAARREREGAGQLVETA